MAAFVQKIELRSSKRKHMVYKAYNIYYLSLYRKSWVTTCVDHTYFYVEINEL